MSSKAVKTEQSPARGRVNFSWRVVHQSSNDTMQGGRGNHWKLRCPVACVRRNVLPRANKQNLNTILSVRTP